MNNTGQNICRPFHLLAQFVFITSESELDYHNTLQVPDSRYEKENTENEYIVAHFEYFFTCHYIKTVWLTENLNEI